MRIELSTTRHRRRLTSLRAGLIGFIALALSLSYVEAQAAAAGHTFRYIPDAGVHPQHVYAAGDFNGWSTTATELAKQPDGSYTASVALTDGNHAYKFMVDGQWLNDPTADKSLDTDDGNGGKNSGVHIGAGVAEVAAPAADGHLFKFTPDAASHPKQVFIAGDFNGWSTTATELLKQPDGSFTAHVKLTPGNHAYKFIVDGNWTNDPAADKSLDTDDGNGGKNSGVKVDAEVAAPAADGHLFKFTPDAASHPKQVFIAGDFNGWSTTATELLKQPDGSFAASVKLAPGSHAYKFVVDGQWMQDPAADKALDTGDGNGGKNSGVHAETDPAPVGQPVLADAAPQRPADAPLPAPIEQPHASVGQLFRYTPGSGANPQHVNVAGDFNSWSTTANELTKQSDGSYTTHIDLTDGVHGYKFVIDGQWKNDPHADKSLDTDDGNGGKNSGVLAGVNVANLPPPVPGKLNAAAVSFDPQNVKSCDVVSDALLRLTIAAQATNVSAAVAWMQQDGQWKPSSLARVLREGGIDRFGGLIQTTASSAKYFFELRCEGNSAFVAGGTAYPDRASAEAAAYSVEMKPDFVTPDWAKHAVWYQIFPERFRNGDTSNDPPQTVRWTSRWYSRQPGEKTQFYRSIYNRRYGGDLQGVRDELPYLRKLGINAIYLNPVFQAESLHKYDATDYRHIDEHFGTVGDIEALKGETEDPATWQWTASDKLMLDLVAEAHRQGFRVILDGVFNHVGRPFWAFQDVIKNGKNSKYADWFDITSWSPGVDRDGNTVPFQYKAWDGDNGSLPAFKKDAVLGIVHGPREHILAIARRWLAPDGDPSRGIDGFRLDAPENVPHPFWVDFRKTVKQAKPDAYIDGEIWSWAQPWLSGDQFDATMNYQFAIPTQQFFVDQRHAISPEIFAQRLSRLELAYPFQVALVNQNLLDSHDTDRAASMFVNPDLGFNSADRLQDTNPKYNPGEPTHEDRARMMQEAVLQMTFVGAPMIYYGDEAGMYGAGDPSDRKPMVWPDLGSFDDPSEKFDTGKFDWYQRLIAIRNQFPELQTGFFNVVEARDDGVLVFARTLGAAKTYVLINRSPAARTVKLKVAGTDTAVADWLDPAQAFISMPSTGRPMIRCSMAESASRGALSVHLSAWGSAILAPMEPAR